MQNNILQLPVRFQKKGFLYWQICRTDQAAIYEQRVEDGSAVFYEVWKIRIRPAYVLRGLDYPVSERAPGTQDWGTYGWTFRNLPDARKRYDLLNGRDNVPGTPADRVLAAVPR